MTKEQEIYQNMKKKGRIYKSHGKWGIASYSLYLAIKEAGYNEDEKIYRIREAMIKKGYIRLSNSRANKGIQYIIEKWVN